MSLHVVENDLWKQQLQARINNNLNAMIKDAQVALKHKLADLPPTSHKMRFYLQTEYERDIRTFRAIAAEELKAEVEREERDRQWTAKTRWDGPDQWDEAFVREQIEILNSIRQQASNGVPRRVDKPVFVQGSSTQSYPRDFKPSITVSSTSTLLTTTTSTTAGFIVHREESPTEREARLRRENHEKQQEDFRKRAEAIIRRKQQEKEIVDFLNWAETMSSSSSSTSSSDQETAVHQQPMCHEDIISLVIFHDQQWSFIAALSHLQWCDFPWPILSFESPKRKEDLTIQAIKEYILAPIDIQSDRRLIKERLKEQIRKWHPDRFETKYVARVADLQERELVREGAGIVARILNELLAKCNVA